MKKILILSMFLGWCGLVGAQKLAETIEKMNAYYEAKNKYELTTTYSLYRGHNRSHISEQYKTKTLKEGKNTYISALNSEIIHGPDLRLVIDHETKKMHYQPLSVATTIQHLKGMSGLSNYYRLEERQEENGIICLTLALKDQRLPVDYSKIKLYVNASNHSIHRQELYSDKLMKFYEEDGSTKTDNSLLVIEFKEDELKEKLPVYNQFIIKGKGDKVSVSPGYSAYQIVQNTNN